MRQGEAPENQEERRRSLCLRPAWAWLCFAAGLVAMGWPFWAGATARAPWPLFLYLFLLWAAMVAGLAWLGRSLARRCDPEETEADDEAERTGVGRDV